ncbi:MAG: hypothetical protein Q8Q02_07915 [Nocardioides sp.]|nr:hypothetical protein [Nocardioides sp.]
MTADTTVAALAHGAHGFLVLGGLAGALALIAPVHLARAGVLGPARATDHAVQVARLRRDLGLPVAPLAAPLPALDVRAGTWLPLAVLGSAAAAGVHAALALPTARAATLLGIAFAVLAIGQLLAALALATGATRARCRLTLAVHLVALLALFVARTTGLPVLAPTPEAWGGWDVAVAGWQLLAVVAVLVLLLRTERPVVPRPESTVPALADPVRWHRPARVAAVVSLSALLLLALAGGGA